MYIQEFVTEILTWIEQNPYLLSVNWACEYEIALRGIFWLFGYAFFFSSGLLDETFFCRFYHSLLAHGHAIYDRLSAASSDPLSIKSLVAQASFLYLLSYDFSGISSQQNVGKSELGHFAMEDSASQFRRFCRIHRQC